MAFQHYQVNKEVLANEKASQDKKAVNNNGNAPSLYLKEGLTQVRILPPYSEKGVWYRKIEEHRLLIDKKSRFFTCPGIEEMPCPICEKGEALYAAGGADNVEEAKSLQTRSKYLYNVLVISSPSTGDDACEFGKVYMMQSGVQVFKQILELDQDEATGWADITDLEKGVNITIKRSGKGLDTSYDVNPHGSGRSSIVEALAAQGIDINSLELIDLDKQLMPPSYEDLEQALNGAAFKKEFPGAGRNKVVLKTESAPAVPQPVEAPAAPVAEIPSDPPAVVPPPATPATPEVVEGVVAPPAIPGLPADG